MIYIKGIELVLCMLSSPDATAGGGGGALGPPFPQSMMWPPLPLKLNLTTDYVIDDEEIARREKEYQSDVI